MEAATRTGATVKAAGGGGGLGFLEAGTRVWVPHAAKAFCCAEVVGGHHASTGSNSSGSGQHLTVAYIHDGYNDDQAGDRKEPPKVVTVARTDVLGRVEDNWLTPLDDLVDLAELSEPAILHHIKQRHARDLIYARDLAPPPRTLRCALPTGTTLLTHHRSGPVLLLLLLLLLAVCVSCVGCVPFVLCAV
jgi:hypothetical protein